MKYQLEYHPNPNRLSIHLNKEVTGAQIESFKSSICAEKIRPEVVNDIFSAVEGVSEITLQRYEISVGKGVVFGWDDMIDQILLILQMHLDPEGKQEEKKAPMRYYIDRHGYRQDITEGEPEKVTNPEDDAEDIIDL